MILSSVLIPVIVAVAATAVVLSQKKVKPALIPVKNKEAKKKKS